MNALLDKFAKTVVISDDLSFVELTKLNDKRKWVDRFCKSYSGNQMRVSDTVLLDPDIRVILAIRNGKELGYIRIYKYNCDISKFYGKELWRIAEAYVKPAYRSNGVLRAMIKFVVENYNAIIFKIETDRLRKNFYYYQSLGFTYSYQIEDTDMSLVSFGELEDALDAFNNECRLKLAA